MRGNRWIVALAMMGAAGMVVAGPQESPRSEKEKLPSFQEADADGDGALTLQEVRDLPFSEEKFREEDLDNDGKLTKYDYKFGIK